MYLGYSKYLLTWTQTHNQAPAINFPIAGTTTYFVPLVNSLYYELSGWPPRPTVKFYPVFEFCTNKFHGLLKSGLKFNKVED